MKGGIKIFLFLFVLYIYTPSFAQSEQDSLQTEKERKWSLNGYVKDMVTFNFVPGNTLIDNLVHNRLNFKWFPKENFNIVIEARNRLFLGDMVQNIPDYGSFIDANNDYFDLSALPVNNNKAVLHTMIDRAYLQWTNELWELRAGRQRINWGTNIVWNPNDLFNAYSFFDFDYEERPGSDALRVTRYFGYASSLEVAGALADSINGAVIASRYKFTVGSYDLQFIGGIAYGDAAFGFGWAGNLGNASLKGEITHFEPFAGLPNEYRATVTSAGIDYSFPNSTYILVSYMWNTAAEKGFDSESSFLMNPNRLTAKNLLPVRHSLIAQGSYPIHPLVNVSLAAMAFPGSNAVFINPSVTWSITQSLDVAAFGQIFLSEDLNGDYGTTASLLFLRLKYSW